MSDAAHATRAGDNEKANHVRASARRAGRDPVKRRMKPTRKRFSTERRPSLQPVDRRGWRRDTEPENESLPWEPAPHARENDDRLAS